MFNFHREQDEYLHMTMLLTHKRYSDLKKHIYNLKQPFLTSLLSVVILNDKRPLYSIVHIIKLFNCSIVENHTKPFFLLEKSLL
jgi:hypothetical protein